MKRSIMLLVFSLMAVLAFSFDAVLNDFDIGMKLAQIEQKQLIVMFSDPTCYYCNLFKKSTLPDETVGQLLKAGYVFVEIYPSDNTATLEIQGKEETLSYRDLYATFGVRGTPTFWFFDETGTPLTSLPGYVQADYFANVLRFLGEKAYARGVSFSDYINESHNYFGENRLIEASNEDAQYVLEHDLIAIEYSSDKEFTPFAVWVTTDEEIAKELIQKGAFRVLLIKDEA
ncbi:thioredoxin family protein [Kosmotoga pacifica]|uniref:Thioredoxin domain-containing protein n=1 Tax=Kosmotoga pacifica TaxID=1330330 RepID=A0A0G2Z5B7_9BACT|nr:thioredoxin fold domain-containing protein [Kosmotoga pacifica]AKI96762.1 hypothetical protein IX53_01810 [Kosmotoga pacifica]